MSVMMDYILSAIVFGVLALTMARIQTNMNASLYSNTYSLIVQEKAVQLAEQIEHDFLKIGYKVVVDSQVTYADHNKIIFKSDLNRTGTSLTVEYLKGDSTQMSSTPNVHDFPLGRYEGPLSNPAIIPQQNWGLTSFKIAYYDTLMVEKTSTPLSLADRKAINAIRVSFVIQSPEPVLSGYDTTWPAVTWEKLIYPRNLNNLQ